MPEGREYELKFSVDSASASRLTTHPALGSADGASRREHLVSTYYDTAEGALRRRRVTLRVRASGRGTVQTLKHSGASLVDRDEWEREGGDKPDLAWLRSTPLAAVFGDEAVTTGLDPRFTVEVDRTILPIAFEGTSIEGAIDEGAIRAGTASLPVHEFELEHKGGQADNLVRLARVLARDVPLVLSLTSKAERGFAVADASWGTPSKSIPLDLAAIGTLGDLFSAVLQGCLQVLCRNAALIGGAENGEAVHATRIALRHIRAALALFQPVLRRRRLDRLKRDLKWMSDRLGAARDADVVRDLAESDAKESRLAAVLQPRHRRAHEHLAAALASARWRLLLIDVLAFSTEGVRRSRRGRRAAPFTRRRVRNLRRRLAKDTRGMRRQRPQALHDLRKRAKMLRYDLELVAELPKLKVRRKRLLRTRDDLQALQQTLGTIHDAEALTERLRESILSRRAPPKGIAKADWPAVTEAARTMSAAKPDPRHLHEAARAAHHLRRRSF